MKNELTINDIIEAIFTPEIIDRLAVRVMEIAGIKSSTRNRIMDELLPCPFCGGEARTSHDNLVGCTKCDAGMDLGHYIADGKATEAKRLWNTRIDLPHKHSEIKCPDGFHEPIPGIYVSGDDLTQKSENVIIFGENVPTESMCLDFTVNHGKCLLSKDNNNIWAGEMYEDIKKQILNEISTQKPNDQGYSLAHGGAGDNDHTTQHSVMEGMQNMPDVVRPASSANPTQNSSILKDDSCKECGAVHNGSSEGNLCQYVKLKEWQKTGKHPINI